MSVLGALFAALVGVIHLVLSLYTWVLIVQVVMSWLIAFQVLNTHSRAVVVVGDIVYRLTEPVLRPLRRVLPAVAGLDLSPLVVILGIMFVQSFLRYLVMGS